ncbi:MAG: hypothetical protein A3B91_05205 [Candidatus Yanofskybacteria bacterium RIFCSPHIGHO2_02_FULL_41_29]|uniref:Uncharacterized protein n=1 Tax=Candidatus Yanofskybacteria bacterium RIFCSPHIGHO2_01_FULL_41_53 TaxID=1802663 RepID=A0A1F8EKV6_9BACT|nr:MAG: hypothetical protein A2650_03955 [Candidatus Yanofskybacteria bacterium RIFCSPHIGHO2_01_FULL_41_53]OGN11688.1 MAG: hypothetical protein A3B91_05205 [Candidatus Yanofskybacteria bacterium RIFCSPHIGHO2_02_FULL_41_29]OGN19187.1 MAG: hypothetical protein A3F48_03000 [Candidatus Yanofskybacteria bacterium RIFCSPHIGHO2_12_FULL_41_9]OGN24447.1 MAG: hypothetical protein A2916_00435 [Candidatus Yanofskybacteria bacterium RIFCSPLOWO2_01_FULL_41_67]OGN30325.1 MAG: hypothetical protein A3H54_04585 
MFKFKTVSKVGIATAMALMPFLVLAQLPTPTSPYAGAPVTLDDIRDLIETVARFLILISVVVAVIFIVWGGMMYMMAGDDVAKAGAAKSRIVNGIIGALVVLAVGLILQTLATVVNWTVFFNV